MVLAVTAQDASDGLKPQIVHELPATRESIAKAFGHKVAELFIPNSTVSKYAAVLRFPNTKVIVSGEVARALRKVAGSGPLLIIARDMTIEARQIAAQAGSYVMTEREFGWTDASYRDIRQNRSD